MKKTTDLPKKQKEKKAVEPLFLLIKDISQTKEYILNQTVSEKDYVPYQINRNFSYFPDTILLANIANQMHSLPKKIQHDFYFHAIRPRARYSKWFKNQLPSNFDVVQEYYKYNDQKTKDALNVLSDEQINDLRKKLEKGGRYG